MNSTEPVQLELMPRQRFGVDTPRPAGTGRLAGTWCHLVTDDWSPEGIEGLHQFAAKLGLKREWYQPESSPHYDLRGYAKFRQAINAGAVRLSNRQLVEWLQRGRKSR